MESLFAGCFAFGFIFAIATFALGAFGNGHQLHLPGFDSEGASAHDGDHASPGQHLSPFNLSTIAAFVTWFGAAGWLLTRYSSLAAIAITLVASAVGLVGGGLVFVTLSRLIWPRLTVMRPEDYRVQGVVGRIASPILESGGTGEVVYVLAGARHVDGARSVAGEAIEQGAEVVILRMERGIAYVERWDRFARNNQLPVNNAVPANNEES